MDRLILESARLAERIVFIRCELYGEGSGGLDAMAAELSLKSLIWAAYEAGVTIPGPIMIHFLVATKANPAWMMSGTGVRYLPALPGERPVVRKLGSDEQTQAEA